MHVVAEVEKAAIHSKNLMYENIEILPVSSSAGATTILYLSTDDYYEWNAKVLLMMNGVKNIRTFHRCACYFQTVNKEKQRERTSSEREKEGAFSMHVRTHIKYSQNERKSVSINQINDGLLIRKIF